MRIGMRLGLSDLWQRPLEGLAIAAIVSMPLLAELILGALEGSFLRGIRDAPLRLLVIQDGSGMGELYGSRIPAELGAELQLRGAAWVVPEIHAVVGSSPAEAVLLRGVDPSMYRQVEPFQVVSGVALDPSTPARRAMVGERLAAARGWAIDDTVELRGRRFEIGAIFRMGSFADNEVWVSLKDAQSVLGWGQDVSLFLVPESPDFPEGEELPGGYRISRRGELVRGVARNWRPILEMFRVCALALGAGAAVALGHAVWRAAWAHRRNLAILRSLGFGGQALTGYVLAQGGLILIAGTAAAGMASNFLMAGLRIEVFGFALQPELAAEPAALTALMMLGMGALGIALPIWRIRTLPVVDLLRSG